MYSTYLIPLPLCSRKSLSPPARRLIPLESQLRNRETSPSKARSWQGQESHGQRCHLSISEADENIRVRLPGPLCRAAPSSVPVLADFPSPPLRAEVVPTP